LSLRCETDGTTERRRIDFGGGEARKPGRDALEHAARPQPVERRRHSILGPRTQETPTGLGDSWRRRHRRRDWVFCSAEALKTFTKCTRSHLLCQNEANFLEIFSIQNGRRGFVNIRGLIIRQISKSRFGHSELEHHCSFAATPRRRQSGDETIASQGNQFEDFGPANTGNADGASAIHGGADTVAANGCSSKRRLIESAINIHPMGPRRSWTAQSVEYGDHRTGRLMIFAHLSRS